MPDLRGLFLRGHGGNSAALGVQQNDAIRNITGSFGQHSSASAGGVFYRTGGCAEDIRSSYGTWSGNGVGFDLSRVVPTAEENRPVNQAIRYLVRARPEEGSRIYGRARTRNRTAWLSGRTSLATGTPAAERSNP